MHRPQKEKRSHTQDKKEKTNKPVRPDDQISPCNELNNGLKGQAHVRACDPKEAASEKRRIAPATKQES